MSVAVPAAREVDAPAPAAPGVRLGLRPNLAQFSLLVAVNALVGATIGQERTVLPLLGEREFGLTAYTAGLTFIVAFGITKALTNLVAGTLADRVGRKPVLVAGWLVGIPVPLLLIWAPGWGWVIVANVLLGVNQGLTWSTTVIMKIDLAGPERRGLAMGLNEAAGYGALAATAAATGWIATNHGLRPEPFLLGAAYIALGLGLSAVFVRETRGHAQHEAADHAAPGPSLGLRQVLAQAAWRDRRLLAINQAGLVNNLNDGLAWGLLPILFAADGLSVAEVGVLAAVYPGVWATGQLVTGALSDRTGRKPLIVTGMLIQATALAGFAAATGAGPWAAAAVALGVGTAFVYPTLLAAVGDVAHPTWRASAVGVYRLWRDSGYAVGALIAGITADLVGLRGAILTVAALTAASGLIAARLLTETHLVPGRITSSMKDTPTPSMGLVLDCADPQHLAEFWAPALGYVDLGMIGSYALLLPDGRPGPKLLLQQVPEPKTSKNRMHLDIETPDIETEAAAARNSRRPAGPAEPGPRTRHLVHPHDRPRGQRVLRVRQRRNEGRPGFRDVTPARRRDRQAAGPTCATSPEHRGHLHDRLHRALPFGDGHDLYLAIVYGVERLRRGHGAPVRLPRR